MLLALTLCVSASLPVPQVPRPGGPLTPVAQVLLSEKDVNIEPGGGQPPFKAARGMLLQRVDRVVVGPGAWVALAILANDQVVRLDDDLSLQVGELALLDAPRHSQSTVQQLDALLTTQERERTERLIGWHASQTAANTQPAQPQRREVSKSNMPKSEEAREKKVLMKDAEEAEEAPRPRPPAARPPAPPPGAPAPAPKPIAGVDAQLQSCVDGAVAAWGPQVKAKLGASLLVSAVLREGEIRVRLPLGLPAPACAAAWFKQHGGLGPTWTSVKVPLK